MAGRTAELGPDSPRPSQPPIPGKPKPATASPLDLVPSSAPSLPSGRLCPSFTITAPQARRGGLAVGVSPLWLLRLHPVPGCEFGGRRLPKFHSNSRVVPTHTQELAISSNCRRSGLTTVTQGSLQPSVRHVPQPHRPR